MHCTWKSNRNWQSYGLWGVWWPFRFWQNWYFDPKKHVMHSWKSNRNWQSYGLWGVWWPYWILAKLLFSPQKWFLQNKKHLSLMHCTWKSNRNWQSYGLWGVWWPSWILAKLLFSPQKWFLHPKNTCLWCIALENPIETDKVMVSEVYGGHLGFWQNCYFYSQKWFLHPKTHLSLMHCTWKCNINWQSYGLWSVWWLSWILVKLLFLPPAAQRTNWRGKLLFWPYFLLSNGQFSGSIECAVLNDPLN